MDKMAIPVFVVNLPSSLTRREYMEKLLSDYPFMDVTFIPAINGRQMTEDQRKDAFDYEASMKHYGRLLNDGEIGCALSHRLCYKSLLDSDSPYAMILEDDISIIRDFNSLPWDDITRKINVSQPRVVFFSGDYWRMSSKSITRAFDAVGAYAYIINKAAASAILSVQKPFVVADDWLAYKRLGIKLYALYPYAADANLVETLVSDVKQDSWSTNHSLMSRTELARRAFPAMVKLLMKKLGLFVSKYRG